uniref:Uncharacterized protein n=1 Tax=Anguilla anguilla TaxID=7936 RepID=A0A0E9XBC1_ANGAN
MMKKKKFKPALAHRETGTWFSLQQCKGSKRAPDGRTLSLVTLHSGSEDIQAEQGCQCCDGGGGRKHSAEYICLW